MTASRATILPMAIRFQCGACAQPIEVDDEWATKLVACPYCRKTVTAPQASTLEDVETVPTATPVAPAGEVSAYPPVPEASQHPNRIAAVALVLACAAIVMLMASRIILAANAAEMQPLLEAIESAQGFNEVMAAQQKFYDAHGGPPAWLMGCSLLVIGSLLTALAGIVCGIIGLRHPRRRTMAGISLIVSAIIPILCCGGAFLGI